MRVLLLTYFAALFMSSCKNYVQVFDIEAVDLKYEDNVYVFENDTVKISYHFWSEYGAIAFSVYNKTSKPLYIDWKRSSYMDNTVLLKYWKEKEGKVSNDLEENSNIDPRMDGLMPFVSTTTNQERITNIPPRSYCYRSQFYAFPFSHYSFDPNAKSVIEERNDNPEELTEFYYQFFKRVDAPADFRNYLTFSMDTSFSREFYVDNQFYVSKVLEMDERHFMKYKYVENSKVLVRNQDGSPVETYFFKRDKSFYLYIPRSLSFEKKIKQTKHSTDE